MGTQRPFYEESIKSKQMPSMTVFGVPDNSLTQAFPIGTRIFDENTGAWYEYVKFGGTVAANELTSVNNADGFTSVQSPASAAGVGARNGVCHYAAVVNQFGFICKHGKHQVKASGTGYVLGDPVGPDVAAAGKVIEWTVTTPTAAEVRAGINICGFALAVESGGEISAYLNRLD